MSDSHATPATPLPAAGERWVEPKRGQWSVYEWNRKRCRCYGAASQHGEPEADPTCEKCSGTGWDGLFPAQITDRLSEADARLLAYGGAAVAALEPFARVTLPDTWPADCMLTFRADQDPEGPEAGDPPYPTYFQRGVTGGPAVDDYRAARAALARVKGASGE
jgi:hypothetical protein